MKCLKDNEIQTVLYSRTTQCPFNDFQRGLIPPNDFFMKQLCGTVMASRQRTLLWFSRSHITIVNITTLQDKNTVFIINTMTYFVREAWNYL